LLRLDSSVSAEKHAIFAIANYALSTSRLYTLSFQARSRETTS
jgi:hypothetical protein